MIFKQGILREEKLKALICAAAVLVPMIALIILCVLTSEEDPLFVIFSIPLLVSPILLICCILLLINLEWYNIYSDRIEARCVFGIKNTVYFNKVKSVEALEVTLTARGWPKQFYFFDDGRRNNRNFLSINSCYNKKSLNFRIYKTPELEDFLVNTLHFLEKGILHDKTQNS